MTTATAIDLDSLFNQLASLDGKAEIITGTGPNGGSQVRVWKVGAGGTISQVVGFSAYDSSYKKRVYVAAGDVGGDGIAEIVTGSDR